MANFLEEYKQFVDQVTSGPSKDHDLYIQRLNELKEQGCDIERLDMAINGLMSESGEAMEILKKLKFQGKPWDKDVRFHLMREAGDVVWYWINLCMALGYSPEDVIKENVNKLKSRYPEFEFSVARSENRKEGDI